MKICLINPPHQESLDSKLDPPLGLMYIASVIRNLNHEVSIIDLSFYEDTNQWKNIIPNADLYGMTVFTSSLHHAVNIKNICKNINPKCKVMIGGAHPSALPRETMNLGFDIIVVGDCEGVINHILDYVKLYSEEYPTMIFGNLSIMKIDDIPYPTRDLVPITHYTRTVYGEKATSIIASRGCPYKCSFCMNSTRKDLVKFRSVDNIIREMKEIIFKYNFKAFIFYDDTFTIHPNIDELLNEIKKLNIIFRCNGNARKDRKEIFNKLHSAGCREISFGIESGSQDILNRINKKVTVLQNTLAIYNAKEAGLVVKVFLMVGSPGESWKSIKKTVNFMNETRPQQWTLFNFVPLPGCDIWNNPDKYGIKIINRDYKNYFNIQGNNEGGLVVETEYMTSEDIRKAREYMIKHLPKQIGNLQLYYEKLK